MKSLLAELNMRYFNSANRFIQYYYTKRVTQKSITTERVTLFHYLSAFP